MLSELFKAIGEQAVKAAGPQLVPTEAEPSHVYAIAEPGGGIKLYEAKPAPRNHNTKDLNTIATFIADHGSEKVNVWYSRHAIVALVDDETRRDRVTMPLELSPQVQTLQQLEKAKRWDNQTAFIRLLRIDLAGTQGLANLIDIVRHIKFDIGQSGDAEVRTGKSSLGKQVRAEMQGADAFPESLTIQVPIFHGHPWQSNLSVALDIDPAPQNFQMVPLPGEIEKAIRDSELKMAGELSKWLKERKCEAVPVYYGAP